ncbi:sigma-70 family RNA polymerase sigma factor [Prevotella sp. A2931]|uniref:Sigma-70 family RNA polymerase sigma factor n=1 Tax=Prevotella illustrans TaxID=2800387 RepID=A0ABS3M807_9BACT|nr:MULTISPECIES: sigma-70 family RNA polymerase sigma factor [Prevotella]MBO1364318.1 sigma-70 family RNA polymerase sigma factor [Prevotella illustrans]PTL25846.1 RNA polymerase subunit sigma-24 [Prevotella sp. oral taxon 820]
MKNLEGMTDEELALCYVAGDNRAFDLLLERNQSKLFAYIMFVVRDHDKADDIFQETFVKVITKLQQGKYVNNGKFSAWIMRIAHNIIMDSFRMIKNEKVIDTDNQGLFKIQTEAALTNSIEHEYVNTQVLLDVKNVMEQLPATQREVVYMRYYQQLSFKEIAQLTNVSINTSLGRMRYAILNMRRMVRDYRIQLQVE